MKTIGLIGGMSWDEGENKNPNKCDDNSVSKQVYFAFMVTNSYAFVVHQYLDLLHLVTRSKAELYLNITRAL